MANHPFLVLPLPSAPEKRSTRPPPRSSLKLPGADRQQERLGPKFAALREQLDQRRVQLRADATGVEPEEVIVLEIAGSVDDFANAVRKVDGLEWLGELVEPEIAPDDDFFETNKKGERKTSPLSGRLFLVFTNQTALAQILSMWTTWQQGQKLPYGFTKWRDVFVRLRDVRRWDARDRIAETGLLESWQDLINFGGTVRCEIELWHRQNPDRMRVARESVEQLVVGQGGRVTTRCSIGDIAYHAIVAELPRQAVEQLLADPASADAIDVIHSEDVQFVRPVGQFAAKSGLPDDGEEAVSDAPTPMGEPITALLDGLPLQNHSVLADRLIVDDPDDFGEDYPAIKRVHGTSMASLVCHGDLGRPSALSRKVYVRPILRPNDWDEEFVPDDHLVVDLIHRAVRRMREGDGKEAPSAPGVTIINLSIGDRSRPFHNALSPLARLLDWLSWRYDVLFLVSAGNHALSVRLPLSSGAFSALPKQEQAQRLLQAVSADRRLRRLLSPSEAVNVLTVGASHADASDSPLPVAHHDVLGDSAAPSPFGAIGLGYRRSVKPDLLAAGGRCLFEIRDAGPNEIELEPYDGPLAPGVQVAVPSARPGDTSRAVYTRGTSVACAMATHVATRLYDVVESLRSNHAAVIDRIPRALWIKALLVHGAIWRDGYDLLSKALKDDRNGKKLREFSSRFLGYGALDADRLEGCPPHRATALGAGLINAEEKRVHRFPLPPSLSAKREQKRLSVTLAWFTPINPFHQGWRRAELWFQAKHDALKVSRNGADHNSVRRGTVQHEVFDGNEAAVFVDGDDLAIEVNCKPGAGALEETIPYAIVVTLEVNEGVAIPIYEEVSARIRQRAQIRNV